MRTSVVKEVLWKSSIRLGFWIIPEMQRLTHCTFGSIMGWMIGISWKESTDDQIRCLINVGDLQIPLNDKRGF